VPEHQDERHLRHEREEPREPVAPAAQDLRGAGVGQEEGEEATTAVRRTAKTSALGRKRSTSVFSAS
jgi:hypothetical protein